MDEKAKQDGKSPPGSQSKNADEKLQLREAPAVAEENLQTENFPERALEKKEELRVASAVDEGEKLAAAESSQ